MLPDSGMVFFANDQDVAGETMVKDLPQIAPNVVVLQAVPPQEAICVRVAAKLALEKNFWDQAQQGGAMSQQSFCTALQALQIPGCDPEQVWSLSMGNQPATDHATFLAHFSAFECFKSTMLRASTAEDSDVVTQLVQGVTVISLSEPVPVGERMVGEVDCQGQRGFVTFSVGDTMYLQRTFSFLPPPPVELPNEEDSATVAAEDQKIDDAIGLEIREENAVPDAEHDKPKKGKSKGKGKTAGRPRLALTRVTQVLKDIRKLQASTTLLVPKACFQRLVREILEEVTPPEMSFRMSSDALTVLQEVAEQHVTSEFAKLNMLAHHRRAVTIELRDQAMLRDIRAWWWRQKCMGQFEVMLVETLVGLPFIVPSLDG